MPDTLDVEGVIILKEAIAHLSPAQQAVLAMNHAGYKQKEIAEILGITRNSVAGNLTKATTLLSYYMGA